MAGVRFKSLQAATPRLDEQFDRILFVVNLAQPNTTLCQTGAELKTRFAMQRNAATALMPPAGRDVRAVMHQVAASTSSRANHRACDIKIIS